MRGGSFGEATASDTPAVVSVLRASFASCRLGGRWPAPPPPPFGWFFAPPFGAFLVPLMIRPSALDRFAGGLGETHLAALLALADEAEPDLGRLLALRIDQHQLRQMQWRLLLTPATGFLH